MSGMMLMRMLMRIAMKRNPDKEVVCLDSAVDDGDAADDVLLRILEAAVDDAFDADDDEEEPRERGLAAEVFFLRSLDAAMDDEDDADEDEEDARRGGLLFGFCCG